MQHMRRDKSTETKKKKTYNVNRELEVCLSLSSIYLYHIVTSSLKESENSDSSRNEQP